MEQLTIFDELFQYFKDESLDCGTRKIKVLSLFSGIGAFEKALDLLSKPYDLVAYCEIDKHASKSYSAIHNVPESKNLGDITMVDETKLPKDIDLVTYGFPCQDISLAGNQRGLFNEDGTQTRSGLFFDALRIIKETQPRVAIAENVKNLTGKKFKNQFKIVLDSLEKAGYNNYWKVLNAKDYGIPQNRERVFIVSIRHDVDSLIFQFPKAFPLKLLLPDLLEEAVDQKYYLGEKGINLFAKHQETRIDRTTKESNITILQLGHGFNPGCEMDADVFPTLTIGSAMHWHSCLNIKKGKVIVREDDTNSKFSKNKNVDFGIYREMALNSNCKLPCAIDEQNVNIRMDGTVGTITTDGSTPKHNNRIMETDLSIRKLTPKECFRLMGFDDLDFEKAEAFNSNTQLYKQAGNSIVVPVVKYIIKALLDCGAL
jgi:DNA (cytosine-5)-methyltransferase 1